MRVLLGCGLILGLWMLVGCGRGLKDAPSTFSSGAPAPVPSASLAQPFGSGGHLSNDNLVVVNPGITTSGADVTVPPAVGSENALVLGKLSDGFAASTGVIVHTASTNTIVLFGAGLSGSMSVIVSGPSDIGVSNIRSLQAKDGTPGVAFDAVVGSSTALGARSVYLKAPNNDITALAGGLEVQP